jgi:hypothetical protein
MERKTVLIGVANKNEQSMKVEDIKDWKVEKVSHVGSTTYFKQVDEEGFYSLDRDIFNELFSNRIMK